MTLADLLAISAGNLWRMKLRAFLTISGVVIAIGAFVSMLSFGAGNQQYVTQQYNDLGLFTTMQVYPIEADENDTIATASVLDQEAVEKLSEIPGVNLAYPFNDFSVTVTFADTQFTSDAQALPISAIRTKLFSQLQAGTAFSGDSSGEALVSEDFLETLGIEEPDSIIGKQIIVWAQLASIDSGLAGVLRDDDGSIRERLSEVRFDSLKKADYRRQIVRQELQAAMDRFLSFPQRIHESAHRGSRYTDHLRGS
jgi:hypothetical protein